MNQDTSRNIRREASKYVRKEKGVFERNIKDLELNSKNKNNVEEYRGLNKCKKYYQRRKNIVKKEMADFLNDNHKILNSWKYCFCQLSNVHGESGFKQIEMHAV
jgi:hypothetical protein